ncbi:MAG: hypothetical protein JWR61_1505 [Ferruginibacter sp.]|uniref:nuclear transport factor 2 family protein n=1 Tax=Ferruginibacter sp. TaxID=1940288 RepID=UPI00265B61E4|nr:nuclear transport factor 2 family protein [Ferruginibacter sp.]MDB5276550.1 hypothetical protein [Ferruginibacter sp.]
MKKVQIETIIKEFINTANEFNIDALLTLFAKDAVIKDVSVGETFRNTTGVRRYLERFFIDYHTQTRAESFKIITPQHAIALVDFTGDFGHETGGLEFTVNNDGLINTIEAYLD